MKHWKRLTALVLAGVLMLGCLTGCCADNEAAARELGEAYVTAYLEYVNKARHAADPTLEVLENDAEMQAVCEWMLDQIGPDGEVGDILGYIPEPERGTTLSRWMHVEVLGNSRYRAKPLTEEVIPQIKNWTITEADKDTYKDFQQVGVSYRIVGGKIYVARAIRMTGIAE